MAFWIGGAPWRMCISIGTESETWRTGIGGIFPARLRHAGHVDEDVVFAELAGSAKLIEGLLHAEGADHMERDRKAELAADLPALFMAGQVDLAAHDHGDQLIVGGKMLRLDAPGVFRIFRIVAPALEIAEHDRRPASRRPSMAASECSGE
jgi:hypothetical protein